MGPRYQGGGTISALSAIHTPEPYTITKCQGSHQSGICVRLDPSTVFRICLCLYTMYYHSTRTPQGLDKRIVAAQHGAVAITAMYQRLHVHPPDAFSYKPEN